MLDITKLREKTKNKTVGIVVLGKSIYELEKRIEEFKDKDICWVGIGQFDIVTFINFDIVFDTASVPESRLKHYEPMRIGRINKYLSQDQNKIWITSGGLKRDVIDRLKYTDFWEQYSNQILFVDSLFPRETIGKFMDVPNSLTLCVGAMIAGLAKNIIIFGCDGYNGPTDTGEGVLSYYKPEEIKKERMAALGSIEDPGINRDTKTFENKFKDCYLRYATQFDNFPDVFNCSSNTIYTHIRKIDFDDVKTILSGNALEPDRGPGWHLI